MLLDIAKESSDACAPLKSCLGGICALIKHHEVRPLNRTVISLIYSSKEFKDVEEQLVNLIPWLNKLRVSVTTSHTGNNREDGERREQLTRFVLCVYHLTDSS